MVTTELGALFGEVSRRQGARIHSAVSSIGIGRGMPPVLWYIMKNDGCKQTDIRKLSKVAAATVTVMLQSLEKNGFIIRKTDEADQRCIRIYITEKGIKAAHMGREMARKTDEELFSCLNEEEQASLKNILIKLKNKLENKGSDE